MGVCAHCSHDKYVRFGIDKGSQRYKCKSCSRSFTEYTGTWLRKMHFDYVLADSWFSSVENMICCKELLENDFYYCLKK